LSRSGILCGLAWCVDRNLTVATWPAEETVSMVLSEVHHGGCPGYNMSTALKRLGAPFPISAAGLLGEDPDGRLLYKSCSELGIDCSQLEMRPGLTTSYVMAVTAKDTGKRTFFSTAGAHAVQTPDDVDFTKSSARIAHLGLPGLHEKLDRPWGDDVSGWVSVLKKARAAGIATNLEMASFEPAVIKSIVVPMLPWLDSLIVNDFEAAALTGLKTVENGKTNPAECRVALERLMQAHANLRFAVIHFPLGAVALERNGAVIEQPSVNVPKSAIVGSNGAGDCFAAGVLFGHHEGWPMQQGMKLGHAAAASSLRAAGTTTAVMPWKDCLALADQWGWR
jgi:sugar/nucleoside kinase (ribokinase family)